MIFNPKLKEFVFRLHFLSTAKDVIIKARREEEAYEKVLKSREGLKCSKATLLKVRETS